PGGAGRFVSRVEPTVNILNFLAWVDARLGRDERGASLVEYGFLVALIATVAVVALRFLGQQVPDDYNSVGSAL
ncbi:MAG: Flp family type IVb pilin, partial [Acidimicrobiia bacterium]